MEDVLHVIPCNVKRCFVENFLSGFSNVFPPPFFGYPGGWRNAVCSQKINICYCGNTENRVTRGYATQKPEARTAQGQLGVLSARVAETQWLDPDSGGRKFEGSIPNLPRLGTRRSALEHLAAICGKAYFRHGSEEVAFYGEAFCGN